MICDLVPTVFMHLDHGNHKLAIPLPSGERVFSLRENLNVSSLLEDVMAEDASVKSVFVSDKNGRLSKGTPVETLLSGDWTLSVDGKQFLVKSPPRSLVGGQYVSMHPNMMKHGEQMELVKTFLAGKANDSHTQVALSDYLSFAEDNGLSKEKAMSYLRLLHKLGTVLFFEQNQELNDRILLNPKVVAHAIEKALTVPQLKSATRKALEAHLETLKQQLKEMHPIYEIIDAKANRSANVVAYSVLGGLLFQWLLFARFTWWDFSWDVMEPVTYFTMTAELSLGGYLYYLWDGSAEYANLDAHAALYNWRFRAISKRRGFDIDRWNAINNGIVNTQQQIAHYQD